MFVTQVTWCRHRKWVTCQQQLIWVKDTQLFFALVLIFQVLKLFSNRKFLQWSRKWVTEKRGKGLSACLKTFALQQSSRACRREGSQKLRVAFALQPVGAGDVQREREGHAIQTGR